LGIVPRGRRTTHRGEINQAVRSGFWCILEG
jgi:hypothetical protein